MDLRNLLESFHSAAWKTPGLAEVQDTEAGVKAVLLHLRDNLCQRASHYSWTGHDLEEAFNDIIGSNSGGQDTVTGGGTSSEASQSPSSVYCEWMRRKNEPGFVSTPHGIRFYAFNKVCPLCSKPVKITGET
jgi:hypothetical protein